MDRSSDNLGQTISNIQRDLEELKSNQGQGGGGGGGGGEEYFAGDGIEIDQSNTISVDTSVVATKTDLDAKQDKLTAGSNISISSNNTISATGIPTKTSDLTNDGSDGTSTYVEGDDLAAVATSGSYNDLSNKPTIDSAMSESSTNAVQNKVISSKVNQIDRFYRSLVPFGTAITANKDLNTVEFLSVGKYYCSLDVTVATLDNCPVTNAFMMEVFSPLSTTVDNETTGSYVYRLRVLTTYVGKMYVQRVNSGATAGTFTYFAWRPIAEGTINDGTLTIQRNGTNVATFTANQSSNTTANIETKELVTNLDARASFLPSTVAQKNKSMTVFTTMNALDSQTQGGGFADALVLSTWNDTSGGRINTLVATKNSTNPELYHYTGAYNGNSWSAKKKIAYTTDIPTVNNGTLTITQNGTTAGTFTANQSSNATIALTDTTYSDMTGATSSTAGTGGLVPAPSAGDQEKYLRGDGTWQPAGSSSDIPDGSVTTPKLANEAVTTAKIADSNVTTAKIADEAVTSAKVDWANFIPETTVNGQTAWKFPDGKMICFGSKSDTYGITGNYEGSWYASTGSNLTNIFAEQFVSTPQITVTLENNSALLGFNFIGMSTTGFSGYIWKQTSKTTTVGVHYMAIGRWK